MYDLPAELPTDTTCSVTLPLSSNTPYSPPPDPARLGVEIFLCAKLPTLNAPLTPLSYAAFAPELLGSSLTLPELVIPVAPTTELEPQAYSPATGSSEPRAAFSYSSSVIGRRPDQSKYADKSSHER